MLLFSHSILKPIDFVVFFKHQDHSAAIRTGVSSSTVTQTKKNASTTSSSSVKNTSH